jgi:hypothetical protein
MAAAKREIYARMATQLLTHERCTIAEVACPGAMGLYLFLVMQARHEKTRGETLEAIALASWGAPTSYRRKQATALVVAGLVERRDGRLVVIRYLDHNDGPEEIEANRERSNKRYKDWQQRHHKRVGDALSPISISCSSSDLRSPEDPERPTSTPRAIPPDPPSRPHNDSETPCGVPTSVVELPPPWWATACGTAAAEVLGAATVDMPGARWREYVDRCERARWTPNQTHAVSWLCKILRSEKRSAPTSRRVDTRQPLMGPEPEWLTRAKTGTGPQGDF